MQKLKCVTETRLENGPDFAEYVQWSNKFEYKFKLNLN